MNPGDIVRYTTGGQLGIIIDICPASSQAYVKSPWITIAFPGGICGPMSPYGFETVGNQ